jgi:hypothetical protein
MKLAFFSFFLSAAYCAEIKVVSFVGRGAGIDDVDNQHMCFKKDLIPGVTIRGTKSSTISSSTLSGYDVVLMPGGSSFYTQQSDVDVQAIKSFVKGGKGYYGTCAGAYGGCTTINTDQKTGVINPYTMEKIAPTGNNTDGSPIYPNQAGMGVSRANCNMYYHVGTSQNKMTATGTKLFGYSTNTDVAIDHHNGPAMVGGGTVAAIFDDGAQKGSHSIVIDTFGSGRSILVSPHPEHVQLQNCKIVSACAAYAGGAIGEDAFRSYL